MTKTRWEDEEKATNDVNQLKEEFRRRLRVRARDNNLSALRCLGGAHLGEEMDEIKLKIPHNSAILFFKRDVEDGSDLDFQIAIQGKGLLNVISDFLGGLYPIVTKGWIDCDRRVQQTLEAAQKQIWALAEEHGVSDLMEEWGCSSGTGDHFPIPPHVELDHDFHFEKDKVPEPYRVHPNGDIVEIVMTGLESPPEDCSPIFEERHVGYVEYLTRRKQWWAYAKRVDTWTELYDDVADAVKAVIALDERG